MNLNSLVNKKNKDFFLPFISIITKSFSIIFLHSPYFRLSISILLLSGYLPDLLWPHTTLEHEIVILKFFLLIHVQDEVIVGLVARPPLQLICKAIYHCNKNRASFLRSRLQHKKVRIGLGKSSYAFNYHHNRLKLCHNLGKFVQM